jgi:hypothetical protein
MRPTQSVPSSLALSVNVVLVAFAASLAACGGRDRSPTGSTSEALAVSSVRQTARQGGTGASMSSWLGEVPIHGSVLCVTVFANTALTVTGIAGGGVTAWHEGPDSNPPDGTMVTYWGLVSGSPSQTVTASFSAGAPYAELDVLEVTGVSAKVGDKTVTGAGTTAKVPRLTLDGPNEVVVTQTWLRGGAVSAVSDEAFVDSYDPVGNGPGIFQSYEVLGEATSYRSETYTQPSGAWYSQAIAFMPSKTPPPSDAGAPRTDSGSPGDSGTKPSDAGSPPSDAGSHPSDAGSHSSDAGSPPTDSGKKASFLSAPAGWSYSQLVWETQFGYDSMGSPPSAPNQGSFVSGGLPAPDTSVGLLNDWNYGVQQDPGAVWSRSGSNPYWGSSQAAQSGSYASGLSADYSFPGNIFQTSTGANTSLFGGYTPQSFTSAGTGLTLWDHYVGGPQSLSIESNGSIYYYMWTSGVLNTEGKRFFPFGAATEFYAQVSAEMAGPNNGSWSAIWTLPDQGQSGAGQEIDIQEYNVSGANEYDMYSHVQAPAVLVGTGTSSTPLCSGYHLYGWHVNSATQTLTTYLDGTQTGTYTGAQVGSKYFLILDAAISSGQASWQTSEGFVVNSTTDMAMRVAEIQVYQP